MPVTTPKIVVRLDPNSLKEEGGAFDPALLLNRHEFKAIRLADPRTSVEPRLGRQQLIGFLPPYPLLPRSEPPV